MTNGMVLPELTSDSGSWGSSVSSPLPGGNPRHGPEVSRWTLSKDVARPSQALRQVWTCWPVPCRPALDWRTGRVYSTEESIPTSRRWIMPLRDHFHPPLGDDWPWDAVLSAWANTIAVQLNQELLPPDYYALPLVKRGGQVE